MLNRIQLDSKPVSNSLSVQKQKNKNVAFGNTAKIDVEIINASNRLMKVINSGDPEEIAKAAQAADGAFKRCKIVLKDLSQAKNPNNYYDSHNYSFNLWWTKNLHNFTPF